MKINQKTKEKICAFYASDYHFEMMSLPYINKNLDENNKIIIFTENNLENTINILLSKINFKEEKKKKIFNIDWKDNDLEKFKKMKEDKKIGRNVIIFIKGKENYINNINKNIEKWIENENNFKIIDCYDVNEIADNMDNIMKKYEKILNTSGEKRIEKGN